MPAPSDTTRLPLKRMFIGIALDEAAAAAVSQLDPHLRGIHWQPQQNLHLTLAFLGDVEQQQEQKLREALAEISVPPFFLPLEGFGSFQHRGRPAVLWLGTGRGHPHLFALHKRVNDAALSAGLEPCTRPFAPHFTIARCRGVSRETVRQWMKQHKQQDPEMMMRVGEFHLYSSRRGPAHQIYRVEETFPLR